MSPRFDRTARRRVFGQGMTLLTGAAVVIVLIPLFAILYEAFTLGAPALSSLTFFTARPADPCTPLPGVTCQTGGIGPAIQGTLILIGTASLIAVPIGVGAALFAVEYGGQNRLARAISVSADILSGVPSILAGVFIYSIFSVYYPTLTFSATTGALALSVLMLPIVTRASEEALRTIPHSVREAAMALGIARWKYSLRITLVGAIPGVLTGSLLAVARAAGEAAPLLVTDFGSNFFFQGFDRPTDSMPLLVYYFATSPYHNWQELAWGCALVLILLVLVVNLSSRFMLGRLSRRWGGS